jgi:hypothetical protein
MEAVEAAVRDLARAADPPDAAVVKLNNGFSGQGNAIVALAGLETGPDAWPTTFCAPGESWASFAPRIEAEGAVVEEVIRADGLVSPSVQVHVAPSRRPEVVSTHDQVLGGPGGQVYLGCRFPADSGYRADIQAAALRVAGVLQAEGVIGSFGIDFLVVPDGPEQHQVYLSEINLRMGGTTHTFWMSRLATGGTYDEGTGELRAHHRAKSYLATDNLRSPLLVGARPPDVMAAVNQAGLAFDARTGIGTTLHLLGALGEFGKMGITCVADSIEEADRLYAETAAALTG